MVAEVHEITDNPREQISENAAEAQSQSRAILGAEAAQELSSPDSPIITGRASDSAGKMPELSLTSSGSSIDVQKTPEQLIADKTFVDKTGADKSSSDNSLNEVSLSGQSDKVVPRISVELQNLSKPEQQKPDFVIKANGEVEIWHNPESSQKSPKDSHIEVVLERKPGQLAPSAEQIAKANDLVKYLSHRLKIQNPEVSSGGIEIDDKNGLVSKDLKKDENLKSPNSMASLSAPVQKMTQDMNRFTGSNGGEMPISQANDYFPPRAVARQENESDRQAAMKEAIAGLFNGDKQAPYETIRQEGDGSYRVGRYGFSGEQLGDFLASLGDPPDPALIDKLVKAGKLPKGFAEKLKDPAFLGNLKNLAHKLDGKSGAIGKDDISTLLPKDAQEGIASLLVDGAKAKVGDNPGAIAAAVLSGRSPDKLSEADINSPQAMQLNQAGQRLYELAQARQQSNSPDDTVKWDSAGKVSIGDGRWLSGDAGQAFMRAKAQASAAGVDIQVNSAGRTFEEQTRLFNELNGVSPVAAPGTSNHESGAAIDIQNYDQAKPFLEANGFVHGDGNGPIANDLWHFKYVG